MKKKWYLNSWFIAICFALWPLYGIPAIIGIILLFIQKRELKEFSNTATELQTNYDLVNQELSALKEKFISLNADEYFVVQEKINTLKNEHEQSLNEFNIEVQNNNDTISRLRNEISSLQEKYAKLEKQTKTQERKLHRSKELYQSVEYAINNFFNVSVPYTDCVLPSSDITDFDVFSPSVILKLHSMDVKDLKKAFKETERQINIVLDAYSSRYTTKANKTIYQLMVIALRAELQNILYELKYEKLDVAIEQVKNTTSKYLKIAGEGNQSIVGTLTKFIGEIEYLFIDEVKIEYNYYVKKEQARQEQLAIKEQMRQEAEERKALAQEKKKIEQEEAKYHSEIEKLESQLPSANDSELEALKARILQLQSQLSDVVVKKNDIVNLQNGKAGNIYIISNLGSFGENVFKIGMTRRLNPQERVDELGSASVPFKFDVHSFIFSDNAVDLENKLHAKLNGKRVNKVNRRKEFFYSTINELEALVASIDPTAEFNKTMLAEEFRQSQSSDEIYTDDFVDSLSEDE